MLHNLKKQPNKAQLYKQVVTDHVPNVLMTSFTENAKSAQAEIMYVIPC